MFFFRFRLCVTARNVFTLPSLLAMTITSNAFRRTYLPFSAEVVGSRKHITAIQASPSATAASVWLF